jgi:hypothetical protein
MLKILKKKYLILKMRRSLDNLISKEKHQWIFLNFIHFLIPTDKK